MNLEISSTALITAISKDLENNDYDFFKKQGKDKTKFRNLTIIKLALLTLYENIHNKGDFENIVLNPSDLTDINSDEVIYIDDINRLRKFDLIKELHKYNNGGY